MISDTKDPKLLAESQIERENINAWDWVHAERYCHAYLERELYKLEKTYVDDARAFTTAIVVTYSRPFSGNRDRYNNRDPADKSYLNGLGSHARAVHDRIVELRNKAFAHSDASYHDVQIRRTDRGGMTTLSRDLIAPLERSDVECLLSNIETFKSVNADLLSHATAKRLALDD